MNKKMYEFVLIKTVMIVVLMLLSPICSSMIDQKEIQQNEITAPQNLEFFIETNRINYTSIFQGVIVTISILNSGNEAIDLEMGGYPGGSFAVYNKNGKNVFSTPKFFLTLLWHLHLEPDEKYTLYHEMWFQRNNFFLLVPNGIYEIYGGTCLIRYQGEDYTPDALGPITINISRPFIFW